jgi:hypothetical protein
MQDPRALANFDNLKSYRAWQREGFRRSGLDAVSMIAPLLVPFLTWATVLFEHATRDARAFVVLTGAAFALYLATFGGLALVAVVRLNAWKRAHPWAPPSPRPSWSDRPLSASR